MKGAFRERKAQVTVFIIIGIILLIAVVLAIMLRGRLGEKLAVEAEKAQPGFTAPVQDYVEKCISSAASSAILFNGRAGGYLALPSMATKSLYENVPFYYDGQDLSPSDEALAAEIGKYVDGMLDLCLDHFAVFTAQGYTISAGNSSSTAVLAPGTLSLKVTLPLRIALGTQITDVSAFSVDMPVEQFYNDLAVARGLAASSRLCITCVSDAALANNLTIEVLPYFNNTYVIDLVDGDYVIDGQNYHLRFAVRHDG